LHRRASLDELRITQLAEATLRRESQRVDVLCVARKKYPGRKQHAAYELLMIGMESQIRDRRKRVAHLLV
jgi:hypothetical protein